jgi:hypothetical protein
MFENRRVFGGKREEEAGGWKILHDEELHNLYVSPNVIRVIKARRTKLAGHVARMRDKNSYDILAEKPEGKTLLGRPRSRWEDNIKMDLKEIGWEVVDCKHLAQDRDQRRALVNTVMKLPVP